MLDDATVHVVARDGAWIDQKLKHEGITANEALAALREHGIDAIDQTRMVVLEADGAHQAEVAAAHGRIPHLGEARVSCRDRQSLAAGRVSGALVRQDSLESRFCVAGRAVPWRCSVQR